MKLLNNEIEIMKSLNNEIEPPIAKIFPTYCQNF